MDGESVAVFLSGQYAFYFVKTAGGYDWSGLVVPNVRIEMDESSLFDPDRNNAPPGSVIRTGNRLVIKAMADGAFGHTTLITLQDELAPTGDRLRAAFTSWQVVIGTGVEKRVLWRWPRPRAEAT